MDANYRIDIKRSLSSILKFCIKILINGSDIHKIYPDLIYFMILKAFDNHFIQSKRQRIVSPRYPYALTLSQQLIFI
jgi:hypothetical protein